MRVVDFKRAFPSVRREIIFKKYAADGINDSLIRVFWAIYKGAKATIRGEMGVFSKFCSVLEKVAREIDTLLFVLFIRDLIEHLESIAASSVVFRFRLLSHLYIDGDDDGMTKFHEC